MSLADEYISLSSLKYELASLRKAKQRMAEKPADKATQQAWLCACENLSMKVDEIVYGDDDAAAAE